MNIYHKSRLIIHNLLKYIYIITRRIMNLLADREMYISHYFYTYTLT